MKKKKKVIWAFIAGKLKKFKSVFRARLQVHHSNYPEYIVSCPKCGCIHGV